MHEDKHFFEVVRPVDRGILEPRKPNIVPVPVANGRCICGGCNLRFATPEEVMEHSWEHISNELKEQSPEGCDYLRRHGQVPNKQYYVHALRDNNN